MNLVLEAARDEHRALVAEPKRARVVDTARVEVDREAFRRFELVERELVRRGRNWRRRDRRELLCGIGVGSADQRGAGRQWSLLLSGRRPCGHEQDAESAGEHK